MSSRPRFQDKIDVLDILISILKDHEENLSNIVDRLDDFIDGLSSLEKRISKIDQTLKSTKVKPSNDRRFVLVECKRWAEFKDVSGGASLIAFETGDNILSVSSASSEFVFKYTEKLLEDDAVSAHPEDSVRRKILNLNPLNVRRWLSEELKTSEDKIIEGRVSTN